MKKSLFILCITIVLLCLKWFVVDFMIVSGESMLENYKDGDIILMEKLNNDYGRFDIVVALPESNLGIYGQKIIKRIVGLPGEKIQIVGGQVLINGNVLDDVVDTYIQFSGIAELPLQLSEDEFFLLGDNRNESQDSRYITIGIIKKSSIVGKIFYKVGEE